MGNEKQAQQQKLSIDKNLASFSAQMFRNIPSPSYL